MYENLAMTALRKKIVSKVMLKNDYYRVFSIDRSDSTVFPLLVRDDPGSDGI